jgi:hypothetical protein
MKILVQPENHLSYLPLQMCTAMAASTSTSTAVTTTTATTGATVLSILLIKGYPAVLVIGGGDLARVHVVHEHVVGLVEIFWVIIDTTHKIILSVSNEH